MGQISSKEVPDVVEHDGKGNREVELSREEKFSSWQTTFLDYASKRDWITERTKELKSALGKRSRHTKADDSEVANKTIRLDADEDVTPQRQMQKLALPKGMNDLPVELLHMILKSIPNLRTLRSFILTRKHFHNIFVTDEDVILTAVLCNDIGEDVMIDYLEIDDLMSLYGIPIWPPSENRRKKHIYAAIASRKQREIPKVIPRATIAYIAVQAGLVRQTLEILINEVLFAVPDYTAGDHVKVFHMDMAHQHYYGTKKHQNFDEFVCKMALDDQEQRRFLRGLHRLQICRMLCSHGWKNRPGPNYQTFADTTVRFGCPYKKPIHRDLLRHWVATVAKTDSFPFNPHVTSLSPLKVFLRSLPPWQKEEVAACAKLLTRGFAYNAKANYGPEFSRDFLFRLVFDHFSFFLETYPPSGATTLYQRPRAFDRAGADSLWSELSQRTHGEYRYRALKDYLLTVSVRDAEPWTVAVAGTSTHTSRSPIPSPYAENFGDAPPLYRAMVHLVKRREWRGPRALCVNRFVDGCWAMWSNPTRLKALPQWKALTEFLENDVLKDIGWEDTDIGAQNE